MDASIPKLIEERDSTKERFKAIVENLQVEDNKKGPGVEQRAFDTKIGSLRLTKALLKQALIKRYRKPLADKIIEAFNENTPSMF